MPKARTTETPFLIPTDRPPARELLFARIRTTFGTLAGFYGFDATHVPPLLEVNTLSPLAKAGLLEEISPVMAKTKTGEDFILRPSTVLLILAAYGPYKMNDLPHPLKLSCSGEVFSLGTGAEGRLKTVSEEGIVMIGEEGPIAEAEIVQVLWRALQELGVSAERARMEVNATGCTQCRTGFRSSFNAHFRSRLARLCTACKRRFKKNPTQILTCTEEKCAALSATAPSILDFLCESCKKHLRGFLEFLDEIGISYFLDAKYFREGSWYHQLIFRIVTNDADVPLPETEGVADGVAADVPTDVPTASPTGGAVTRLRGMVLAEGGRVSKAGELLVGRRLDAVAGVLNPENIERARHAWKLPDPEPPVPHIFLAQLGEYAKRKSMKIFELLRCEGIPVRESLGRDSLKSQLTVAAKIGARMALILGQKEAIDGTVIVREVESGIQETVPQEKLIDLLRRYLKKNGE